MSGRKICPAWMSEVYWISMRGSSPSWIACWVTEKAPVITAWLAITVAIVASSTSGNRPQPGAIRKNGLAIASGSLRISAAWPR